MEYIHAYAFTKIGKILFIFGVHFLSLSWFIVDNRKTSSAQTLIISTHGFIKKRSKDPETKFNTL